MPKEILTKLILLVGATGLTGCQFESVDAGLPPLRLLPPTVLSQPQLAAVRLTHTPPPPIAPKFEESLPKPAPKAPPSSFGSVPAGWVPSVAANHWTWIIIHHSDSDYGSAAIIDKWHRDRGFDELGYHFVIGNGTDSGDGQIEIGPRWTKQKWGAHDNALDNRYNINGIGICLVGNFNKTHPTIKQRAALLKLVVYLMKKYNIPVDHVLGHGETKDTECPGRFLHVAEVRQSAEREIVQGDASPGGDQYADRH